ncbi:superkiller protein 3 [Dentipellis sp. KUC8613]|nr:superkiller protein 3 [Dentipellis sp. KUC8613]
MSSSFVKNKLKNARDAIGRKEYQAALDASSQILDYEPDNYNAKVFKGLSLLELGQTDQSEQVYRSAIEANPKQPLAWQGLSKVYERLQQWDQYYETLYGLARLFSKVDDCTKCAETIQKIVDLRRDKGSSAELTEALSLYLPESPFYSTLSSLPQPDPTNPTATSTFASQSAVHNSLPILEEIVSLIEREEKETIEREVSKRRTRLNAAGPEEIKREVGREVYGASRLPTFYHEILNHPNTSDDLRRLTESKLLRHKRQYLQALPTSGDNDIKQKLMDEVQELVNGIVLLNIPDELAWVIYLDEQDAETIEDYGLSPMRQFMHLFPNTSMARLIQGYFLYNGIPLSEDEEDEGISSPLPDDETDPFDAILEAFSELSTSILAHRVLSSVYLWEVDYENSIAVAEVGLELVRRTVRASGKDLSKVKKAFNVTLATSLVQLYPPKHHARALRIIDEVLQQDPDNVQCLMGRGYILEHSCTWSEASNYFIRVIELLSEDTDDAIRAKEEHGWCRVQLGDLTGGAEQLRSTIDMLEDVEGKEEDRARCWWKLGRAFWDMGDGHRETAYGHFITSLKCLSTFAPAFTSLGIYYSEAATPPDPSRASKCFQKAFELDAREGDAARRLAEGFAEEREWDLVEVVAKRTIEGEGGLEGITEGSEQTPPGKYLASNAWAWKATGVVDLNRRNYSSAIRAFQIALRAQPDDQLSWLRLGEAYSKAGRHVAALKALTRAQELRPDDWICAYLIADVQRQTGQFAEAIASFEEILQERSEEPGVLMSLAQTHLDLGQTELLEGFIARAESSFVTAIDISVRFLKSGPGFRTVAWKTMADAVFSLSQNTSFLDEAVVRQSLHEVLSLVNLDAGDRLAGIMALPAIPLNPITGRDALNVAVKAYNYRISLGLQDAASTGSAWYDLGVALHRMSSITIGDSQSKIEEQAIGCMKKALEQDPIDDRCWRALGDMHFVEKPKASQHAYVRALEINSKDAVTWTHLGLLYLYHDDPDLANEALYKAQTLDPDYDLAWVGQSLVARRNEHYKDSRALLEHAVSLTSNAPDADLEYARREFTRLSETGNRHASSEDMFPIFSILDRYCKKRPDDASALHLFALVSERVGHIQAGTEYLRRAIAVLEIAYEDSEDPIIERQFVIANTSLARMSLALQDYDGALETFQTALGLLPEESDERSVQVLRTQCQFGSGLASFKLGQLEEALESLEAALSTAGDDMLLRGHVTVLLGQVLWAMGTEDGRESAKAQLLECITADPENLTAINALAGMGILTEDDSLIDAALSELLSLPLDRRYERDPQRNVTYLLAQHHLGQGDVAGAQREIQKAIYAEPSRREERSSLARLSLQSGQPAKATALLSGFEGDVANAQASMALHALSKAMRPDGDAEDAWNAERMAQKAIMLAPWDKKNWEILASVRSQNSTP